MAKTQMNTRIDEDVKRKGDAAFAAVGFSPSQVVQVVWQLAAIDETFPRLLADLAIPSRETAAQKRRRRLQEEALEGQRIVSSFYEKLGIAEPVKTEKLDYKKMLEEARLERWEERGLEL